MSGAPNDVSFKDTTRIPVYRGFLYTPFQRMLLYGQDGCVSIVNIEKILLFNVLGLMLRTGFQEGCYEHIPPFKSGEDNQWIQLKIMLIKGACSHTVHDCSAFLLVDISQAKNGEFLTVVYLKRWRCNHIPCFSTWLHLYFSYIF